MLSIQKVTAMFTKRGVKNLGDIYKSGELSKQLVQYLVDGNVLTKEEAIEWIDGEGKFSEMGKTKFESIMTGITLNEDVIRLLNNPDYALGNVRKNYFVESDGQRFVIGTESSGMNWYDWLMTNPKVYRAAKINQPTAKTKVEPKTETNKSLEITPDEVELTGVRQKKAFLKDCLFAYNDALGKVNPIQMGEKKDAMSFEKFIESYKGLNGESDIKHYGEDNFRKAYEYFENKLNKAADTKAEKQFSEGKREELSNNTETKQLVTDFVTETLGGTDGIEIVRNTQEEGQRVADEQSAEKMAGAKVETAHGIRLNKEEYAGLSSAFMTQANTYFRANELEGTGNVVKKIFYSEIMRTFGVLKMGMSSLLRRDCLLKINIARI